MMKSYYVYILKCNDDSLYTGITTDVSRRVKEHNSDNQLGAKYTKGRRPVTLLYSEPSESRSAASQREYQIKKYSRSKKLQLLRQVE